MQNPTIFQVHANVCKMLANPKRLMILALLGEGEKSVGALAEGIGSPMATVSQHLRALRDKHLVESRKEKQTVFYRVADPRILQACVLIRSVLLENMKKRGELANAASPEDFFPGGPGWPSLKED